MSQGWVKLKVVYRLGEISLGWVKVKKIYRPEEMSGEFGETSYNQLGEMSKGIGETGFLKCSSSLPHHPTNHLLTMRLHRW